jgi:hypothetical protein
MPQCSQQQDYYSNTNHRPASQSSGGGRRSQEVAEVAAGVSGSLRWAAQWDDAEADDGEDDEGHVSLIQQRAGK